MVSVHSGALTTVLGLATFCWQTFPLEFISHCFYEQADPEVSYRRYASLVVTFVGLVMILAAG